MSAERPPDQSPKPESEATSEQIRAYFVALGLQLKEYLRILKRPEFKASAKPEGWFMAHHGIVEAAVTLKLGELAGFSEEETSLLLQTSMLSEVQKRRTYETKRHTSTAAMWESRLEGEKKLRRAMPGIDPRVLIISRGTGADFPSKFIEKKLESGTPEERAVNRLEGIYSVIHNSVSTRISRSTGKPVQTTEIIPWQERIAIAKQDHKTGVAQETRMVDGQAVSILDIEAMANAAVETELKRLINERNPGTIDDATPLSALIRQRLMEDMKSGANPKFEAIIEKEPEYDAILVLGAVMDWNPKFQRWDFPTIVDRYPGKLVMGNARARAAAEAKDLTPMLLVTGGVDRNPETGDTASRARELSKQIIKRGVSRKKVIPMGKGGNTLENARDLVAYIKEHPDMLKKKRIAVLTPLFQGERAKMMFEQEAYFKENGIEVDWLVAEDLLEAKDPRYERWVKAVYNSPAAKINQKMEEKGINDLESGTYQA